MKFDGQTFDTMPNRNDLSIYEEGKKIFYATNKLAKRPHILLGHLTVAWFRNAEKQRVNKVVATVTAAPLETSSEESLKAMVARGSVILDLVDDPVKTPDVPEREREGMIVREGMTVLRNDPDESKRINELKRYVIAQLHNRQSQADYHKEKEAAHRMQEENTSLKEQLKALTEKKRVS